MLLQLCMQVHLAFVLWVLAACSALQRSLLLLVDAWRAKVLTDP
jgi:hypothetical protein